MVCKYSRSTRTFWNFRYKWNFWNYWNKWYSRYFWY
jgi:hypothetical protein